MFSKINSSIISIVLCSVILAACGGNTSEASNDSVVDSTTSSTTTTVDGPSMLCDPGSCNTVDKTYIDGVRGFLPPAYINDLSDSQLFQMADTWCIQLSEPGGPAKIRSFVMDAYDSGKFNDYKLFGITLTLGAYYCAKTDVVEKMNLP
jgi:hypothetical protein